MKQALKIIGGVVVSGALVACGGATQQATQPARSAAVQQAQTAPQVQAQPTVNAAATAQAQAEAEAAARAKAETKVKAKAEAEAQAQAAAEAAAKAEAEAQARLARVTAHVRMYFRENFGSPGLTTTWYGHITELSIKGDTAVAVTNLPAGEQDKKQKICGALSLYVYGGKHGLSDLKKIEVYGQGGRLLVARHTSSALC